MKLEDGSRPPDTFCMMPWIHMHILPNSMVLPCCVWPYDQPLGDASEKDLAQIWNTEDYKQLRLNMLSGCKSKGCDHCYAVDAINGKSLRKQTNEKFGHLYNQIVPLTKEDGFLPKLVMSYFDVRFSNLCNFKCRGCSPELSSSWYDDFEKLNNRPYAEKKVFKVTPNERLWKELVNLVPTVEEAYFAGGEPLFMEDHYRILDEFIAQGRTNISLHYNTNVSVINFQGKDICEYWNHFEKVGIGLSIDDIGERGEYFRHGSSWKKTLSNIAHIKSKCPHIEFSVTCTVNVMNVYYLPEILTYLISNKIILPHYFHANLLLSPAEYRIQILPAEFKKKITAKLRFFLIQCQLDKLYSRAELAHLFKNITSVINFMNAEDHTHMIPQFLELTAKLDEIRNESFEKVFPEIYPVFQVRNPGV